ncbi:MAG: hypothetical protein WKF80_03440 [Thermomicrobiales bacterium]
MTPKLFWSYARGRRLAVIAGIALLAAAGAALYEHLAPGRVESALFTATMPAVAVGICAGLSINSPYGELDDAVFLPLRRIRLFGFLAALGFAMVAFAALAWWWDRPVAAATLGRDLVGFAGLTVVAMRLLSVSRAWMPGFAWGIFTLVATPEGWSYSRWAWHLRPADDPTSWVVALALFGAGLVTLWRMPFRPAAVFDLD